MLSKNNYQERLRKMDEKHERFSIRKFSVGVASVLIGTVLFGMQNTQTVRADTVANSETTSLVSKTDDETKQVIEETPVSKDQVSSTSTDTAVSSQNKTENATDTVKDNAAASSVSTSSSNTNDEKTQVVKPNEEVKTNGLKTTDVEKDSSNNMQGSNAAEKNTNLVVNANKDVKSQAADSEKTTFNVKVTLKNIARQDGNLNLNPNWPVNRGWVYNFKNQVLTLNDVKDGTRVYSLGLAPTGFKLMNSEVLKQNFKMDGNVAFVNGKDADVTLEYAPISPILVKYVDEDTGEVLSSSSVGANTSTTASLEHLEGDPTAIGLSKFKVNAINIPGYEVVGDKEIIDTYNNVQSLGNVNYQVVTFKYKKVMENENPKKDDTGSGAKYGEYFGPSWNTIDPADIFNVSGVKGQTYEKDNGDMEAKYQYLIDKYQNQGHTFMGIFNYHKNTDFYNWNEGGTSINLIPNKPVTVKYIDEQGNELSATDTIAFNKNNSDQTNNGINAAKHWYSAGEWTATPKDIKGYTLRTTYGATKGNFTPYAYTVTFEYAKDTAGKVIYIDDDAADQANKTLKTDNLTGYVGDKIDYSTQTSIKDYENQGYILVSDNFPADAIYKDFLTDNTFEVHLKHATKPVNPENPGDKYTRDDLQKTATRTINYVDSQGNKIADSITSTVTFTANGTIDSVTGNLVNLNEDGSIKDQNGKLAWTYSVDNGTSQDGTKYTFAATDARQSIDYHGSTYNFILVTPRNYNAGNGAVASYEVTNTNPQDLNVDVIYTKQPIYHAGKTDTKSVVRDINYLDGKTGEKISESLIQNNPVTQTVNMHRTQILDEDGKVVGYGTVSEDGKSYAINNNWIIDGNWAAVTSPDLTATGYKAPRFENGDAARTVAEQAVSENTRNTAVNVYYDHNEIPVGPDTPDKHGIDPDQLTKIVKETIHYIYSDSTKAAADNVQTSKWTRTLTLDAVTKEVVENGQYTTEWAIPVGEKTVYDQVNTPVIAKYHADKRQVNATVVTQNDIEETVTYTPNGKIVPVDPSGKPIPNVPTPQYPTDPADPTKVTPNEPVPDVPGYTPDVPTVTPTNPGEDTPVVYRQIQKADLTIIDQDNNKAQILVDGIATKFDASGKPSENIVFTGTEAAIKALQDKGYEYVSSDFTDGTKFDTDGNTDQHFVIVMKHGTVPVTPDKPGKPGEPINPTDPEGPKYPTGTNENDLKKSVIRTINYIDGDGNQVSSPVEQTVDFTASGVLDKVTGEWIAPLTWSKDQTVNGVTSPTINGYHVVNVDRDGDGNNVKSVDLSHTDNSYTVTVRYAKNGTVIRNDQTVDASQTVKYVDENGNELSPSKTQNGSFVYSGDTYDEVTGDLISRGSWDKTSLDFTAENVPVIDGYVAVSGYTTDDSKYTAGGFTTTPEASDAQRNRTFTVVYKKVGKIVPVGPDGKTPIPDSPTPTYTNDPTDPTKVTPNEPVPEIPGMTPETPTVTPTVPTEDTPVVYNPDVKDQTVTVKYIDDATGEAHTDLSSYDKTITAKPSVELNYSTAGSIAELENKGYKLVSDNFNVTTMPENGGNYEVHFIHNTTTITPDKPGNPGEPINPNDPDGPKWPDGTDAKSLTKQGSQTVHYVYADGTKAADDNVQNATFDHTLVFDNVTGKQIEDKSWTPESYKFNNVTSPTINGYHADKTVVEGSTVTLDNPTSEITVVYTKNGTVIRNVQTVDASQTVKYVDEDGNELIASKDQHFTYNYTGDTYDEVTGDLISRGSWNASSNDFTAEDVPVIDGYVAVRGYSRGDDGKYTAGGFTTTHEASDAQRNRTFTVVYKKVGKIVPVGPDGKTPIPDSPTPTYTNDPTDPTKVTPNEPVPEIPGMIPSTPTVTPTDPGNDTPVPYNPQIPAKDQVAVVNYVDADENNSLIISSGDLTGKAGEKIDYSTAATIADLETKGYVLVNDGFPAGATFDNDDNTVQTYTVVLRHGTVPVTPDKPGKPGEPINPENPDVKWPDGTGEIDLRKTGSQTIHYVYADGTKAKDDNVQSFDFTKTGVVDKVTGKLISETGWNVDSHTFGSVDTPVIDGYHVDKRTAGGETVTPDDLAKEVTVTYTPNGHIIPGDPDGKPIPNVPTPQYPTDPTDPTTVTPDEPVPTIPGYTPSVPTVTPTDPGKDTPVPYNPVVPAKDQVAVVNYIDASQNNKLITTSGELTGKAGETINYSTTPTITDLTNKGYVLVNDAFPSGAKFDSDDNTTQVYTVVLRHGTIPVIPTDPGKPGEPINPDDPEGPKYPDGSDQVTKNVTRTIEYVEGNGNKLANSVTQTVRFTGQGVLDKVTGKWITPITWSPSQEVSGQRVPYVSGYHVINISRDGDGLTNVKGLTLTNTDMDYTVTVTYNPNGKIIPVDPDGNPIPNVPTPQYPTDPTDPTKVTPDEPVPEIPGYVPSRPTVTPTDPGKDTPVPYTPVTPAKDQAAVVNYVDADDNNSLITSSGTLSGKSGAKIDYSTAATIVELEKKGYVLVTDGFPAGATYDSDDNTTQVYTVVLKHGTVPVTPTEPGKPGEPINPDDPEGPKYPDGSDQVTKNVTRTINYVDGAGNKLSDSVEQTVNFTASGVLDKVTGKWVTPLTWSQDQSVNGVKTPVVAGYHLVSIDKDRDGNNVAAVTLSHGDTSYVVTATYAANGRVIPVDPEGNPIPGVDQPQYPTDPTDPSKVLPTPVPTIPGYTPSVQNVIPDNPAEDTKVVYTPVESTPEVPNKSTTETPQKTNDSTPVSHVDKVEKIKGNTPVKKVILPSQKKNTLPQTSASDNEATTIFGALAATLGITSLIGVKKRRKNDK